MKNEDYLKKILVLSSSSEQLLSPCWDTLRKTDFWISIPQPSQKTNKAKEPRTIFWIVVERLFTILETDFILCSLFEKSSFFRRFISGFKVHSAVEQNWTIEEKKYFYVQAIYSLKPFLSQIFLINSPISRTIFNA